MPDSGYFEVNQLGDAWIIVPLRNVTSLAEQAAQEEFDGLLEQIQGANSKKVVIDFGRIAYFGSSMLEAMIRLWNDVHARDGKMVLCGVSDFCQEILQAGRFHTLWPVYPSRDAAIDALEK